MIYKLYRKEMSVRTPQLISKGMAEQSHFIEEISKMVKLIKKKEMLYLAIVENVNTSSQKVNGFLKGFQGMKESSKAIECILKGFKKEAFYASKTYLYSVFMRVRELLDAQARRFKSEGKIDLETHFQKAKTEVTQIYTNLLYEERYQLDEILEYITKDQNKRISYLLPKEAPSEEPSRPNKLLDLLKKSDSSTLRKTISVEIVKTKESTLEDVVNRKLVIRELATKKRFEQRKKTKPKNGPNLFKLYDILELKPFTGDRSIVFREQLQKNMNQRNRGIKELIKGFEKQCFFYSFSKNSKKR